MGEAASEYGGSNTLPARLKAPREAARTLIGRSSFVRFAPMTARHCSLNAMAP